MPNRSGIASMSLGRPWIHDLPTKLQQAAHYGFEGIELFYEDLHCYAQTVFKGCLTSAARSVREICNSRRLAIICLQPFSFYDGLLDRAEHERLVSEKLPLWFTLAHILETDLIQVPANFLPLDLQTGRPRTTGDTMVIVADLQRIADLGLRQSPPIRFAYEALCWSNHVDTWEASWEVVQRVNRPNFGICLDTFNIAGRVYADPASPTGKTPHADRDMRTTIARLLRTVDPKKVFFVQIVDGERLSAPLDYAHEFYVEGQPCRMSWSRNARLFPFEQDRGGYLPVLDIARAIFELGFEGWVSLELFSRTLADPDPKTPAEHARRGMESWKKLLRELQHGHVCQESAATAIQHHL